MSIGMNIRARRRELNMTQKELADKVQVCQAMICQIERGTKTPTLPLGQEIAQALGVSVNYLLDQNAAQTTT